jgi:hypothetical protein
VISSSTQPNRNGSEGRKEVGAKPRWIVPGRVYEVTVRTVDRCFLFVPNHNKKQPLLDAASPAVSLDPKSDIIPKPSIIDIIGAAIGKALDNYCIRIHAFECNSNHIHIVFSITEWQFENVVPFFRQVLSTIARKVNLVWQREGTVFGGRLRMHPCITDGSASSQLLYAMTNTAKDNLIDKTAHTPFFTTYHHQAKGRPLRYWYIDYDAYHTAGGKRKRSHRLKDYLRWVDWCTTPLPEQEGMTPSQRQTWIRQQVRYLENGFEEKRKQTGHTVLGFKKLKQTDPRSRPKDPKDSGPEPLCHSSDENAKKAFKKELKHFLDQYIQASADYRGGMMDRQFPGGSFRPPLFDVSKDEDP